MFKTVLSFILLVPIVSFARGWEIVPYEPSAALTATQVKNSGGTPDPRGRSREEQIYDRSAEQDYARVRAESEANAYTAKIQHAREMANAAYGIDTSNYAPKMTRYDEVVLLGDAIVCKYSPERWVCTGRCGGGNETGERHKESVNCVRRTDVR